MMEGKTFILKIAVFILITLIGYSFMGCSTGGEDNTTAPIATCDSPDMTVSISNNHGHALSISKADITAGTEKTYSIKGSADHYQYITLFPDDFNLLKNKSSVTVTSSAYEGGTDVMHWHSVRVFCE